MTLGPAGSVQRVLDLGAQAKLTLNLAFTPLNADGQNSTTRFAFQIRDRGEFVVLIVRRREKGKTVGELRLIEQDTPYTTESHTTPQRTTFSSVTVKMTRTLRTFTWQNDFPDGPWTFRHHHGLLTVYRGNKQMGAAYADMEPKGLITRYQHRSFRNSRERTGCSTASSTSATPWKQPGGGSSRKERRSLALRSPGTHPLPVGKAERDSRIFLPGMSTGLAAETCARRIAEPIPYYLNNITVSNHSAERVQQENSFLNLRPWLGQRHPYVAWPWKDWGCRCTGQGNPQARKSCSTRRSRSAKNRWDRCTPTTPRTSPRWGAFTARSAGWIALNRCWCRGDRPPGWCSAPSGRYAMATRELAALYQDTGRVAEAETILRQAAELDKDAPLVDRAEALPTLLLLAEIQARMGERAKAEGMLKQAEQAMQDLARAGESPRPPETWQQCEARIRITKTLLVELARARIGIAGKRLHDGQSDEARKYARAAFFHMVSFYKARGRSQLPWIFTTRSFRAGIAG